MSPTHTLTVRVMEADYQRLKARAEALSLSLADLLRLHISRGLRTSAQAPLAPIVHVGYPKGRKRSHA